MCIGGRLKPFWLSINIFAGLSIFSALVGCSDSKSRNTDTYSRQFSTIAEKIAFLEKYLVIKDRKVLDTEYHIQYHDNSQGLAAPSDWQMLIILKVPENELEKWIIDCPVTQEAVNPDKWYKGLQLDTLKWIREKSQFYTGTVCNTMQTHKIICRKNSYVLLSYSSFTE
jgi:hypothetical protein